MADTRPSRDLRDPLEDNLDYQLRRAALVTLQPLVAALGELGLKPADATILRFVAANPGCMQIAISRALGVQRTNLAPAVAALEAAGHLRREAADKRSQGLYLTAQGEALLARVRAAGEAHEQAYFGFLSDDARAAMLRWCREIRTRALTAPPSDELPGES